MDDIIRIDKVTYDDFTKVKFAPVSREEILENITKTLLWIADKCKKAGVRSNRIKCKNVSTYTPRGYWRFFFLKPKYQFSLRGNIKDRRDLRGGVNFETPSLWFTRFGRACPRRAR